MVGETWKTLVWTLVLSSNTGNVAANGESRALIQFHSHVRAWECVLFLQHHLGPSHHLWCWGHESIQPTQKWFQTSCWKNVWSEEIRPHIGTVLIFLSFIGLFIIHKCEKMLPTLQLVGWKQVKYIEYIKCTQDNIRVQIAWTPPEWKADVYGCFYWLSWEQNHTAVCIMSCY